MHAGFYNSRHLGLSTEDRQWPHAQGFDLAGTAGNYELVKDSRFEALEGCLVIDWGVGTRTWIQRADLQNKPVIEISRKFQEPAFPGFESFIENLSKLEKIPTSWITPLAAAKGIYMLTCPNEKLQYVGSASGEGGFWNRWMEYARTGHGGNVGLRIREPSDYEVSILEVAGSLASHDDILRMEEMWKAKLQSRKMGLNRN